MIDRFIKSKHQRFLVFLPIVFSLIFILCDSAFCQTDVTAMVQINYLRSRRPTRTTVAYDVSVTNISSQAINLPLQVVIDSISPPSVTVDNPDGTTTSGKPFFQYDKPVPILHPGETTKIKTWVFNNPKIVRFQHTCSVWATMVSQNSPPVANAGPDQTAYVGDTVILDGSGSTDIDGDPLTYSWSFTSLPPGSAASLSDPAAVNPSFNLDVFGNYVIQLVVNDGIADSAPDSVTISTLNSPPVANAGPDQTAYVGDKVILDGSGSTDVDGDPLTFIWSFSSAPSGSAASLSDPTSVNPSFDLDIFGNYVIQLLVNDGSVSSAPDSVTISTLNSPPVANAGTDQTASVGDTVTLDGSGSFDVDGNPLTYSWSFISVPSGSVASMSDPTVMNPSFDLDLSGDYVIQLVVNDGFVNSAPDTVKISTQNSKPVADAGPDQTPFVGDTVVLDGSGSYDPDLDTLTYSWSFTSIPFGSSAVLSDPTAVNPNFDIDLPGIYILQLIVNDGLESSNPDTVTITTLNRKPVADAGADQTAFINDTVTLDGSGSYDPDGDPIAGYAWSFVSVPPGSSATLSDSTAVNPTFVPDKHGAYQIQLIVNDGVEDSDPDAVTITIQNRKPLADAGSDQTASVGDTVTLDGSGSYDTDNDPLTYSWSFTSVPPGSSATISDPTAVNPTFNVDVFGDYIIQLVVNDGIEDSDPDIVRISTQNSKPVADAGPDQTVYVNDTVTLDGSGSSDPDNDPLTYSWSFVSVPAGSAATLSDPTAVNPTFVPDKHGTYQVQ
ncbi:hypothetical protein JXL19_05700, partial [bacterium]|nr:hypothetical protein [bacterium]